MRQRFYKRQSIFTLTDVTLEQNLETIPRPLRRFNMGKEAFKRAMMIFDKLLQPLGQPRERQFMAAQHQLIGARIWRQTFRPPAGG